MCVWFVLGGAFPLPFPTRTLRIPPRQPADPPRPFFLPRRRPRRRRHGRRGPCVSKQKKKDRVRAVSGSRELVLVTSWVYLSWDQSLGAAQAVAQWARWKTVYIKSVSMDKQIAVPPDPRHACPGGVDDCRRRRGGQHTLLNAVLLGTVAALSSGDPLNALVKVVLGAGASLRLLAFCDIVSRFPPSAMLRVRRFP